MVRHSREGISVNTEMLDNKDKDPSCKRDKTITEKRTNYLLVVGFYLVNIGFILLMLRFGEEPQTTAQAIRFVTTKVGVVVLVLGGMHFFNMNAIAKFGRKVGHWLREERQAARFAGQ